MTPSIKNKKLWKTTGLEKWLFNYISPFLLILAGLMTLTNGLASPVNGNPINSQCTEMSIEKIIANLEIFVGTFNKRTDADLYFSEKLLTKTQKEEYEKSIEFLKCKLREREQTRFAKGFPLQTFTPKNK